MDKQIQNKQRQSLILILWGALFTKCFTLEYFVQHYAVAINPTLYVWALSIFMATVATFIHLAPRLNSRESLKRIPTHVLLWLASGITMLAITALNQRTDSINLLATVAIILGLTYCLQGILIKQISCNVMSLCWWLSAAILFQTAAPLSLLIFAICILILHILPNLVVYFSCRRSQKRLAH